MKEYIELEQETWELYEKVLPILKEQFSKIDEICESNTAKVLHAFWKNHVSESHFTSTTGYGYDDLGRDTIEKVYSTVFETEDALVRNQFISGSHALAKTLFGLLRPGDLLLSIWEGGPLDKPTIDRWILHVTSMVFCLSAPGKEEEVVGLFEKFFKDGISKVNEPVITWKEKKTRWSWISHWF